MSVGNSVSFRGAELKDMTSVVQLFRVCFADSFTSNPGASRINDRALVDVFTFLLLEERRAFTVAVVDGRVVAYCVTPKSMRRIWRRAVLGGYVFRWIGNWLCGRYGLPITAAALIVSDKFTFAISPYNYRDSDAQILSVGVAPEHRDQGIGYRLLEKGLAYLSVIGVKEIKLEVRPDNSPAQKVYRKLGFSVVGKTPDRRGGWLVMRRHLDYQ